MHSGAATFGCRKLVLLLAACSPTCDGLCQTVLPTDPEYEDNLKYFLEKGVRPDDGCDYLLVVQEVGVQLTARMEWMQWIE